MLTITQPAKSRVEIQTLICGHVQALNHYAMTHELHHFSASKPSVKL